MSTIRIGSVRFRVFPQDHLPVHAHARYAETVVTVVFYEDGLVSLAGGFESVMPAHLKRSDVRKILNAASAAYDLIMDAWEEMHEED